MTKPREPRPKAPAKPAHEATPNATPIQHWQPAPPELIMLFEAAIKRIPEAEPKRMFGYPAALVNGNLFAGLHQSNWILRLSDIDRARVLKLEGASLFQPMPGRPMRDYVVVPPSLVRAPEELHEWMLRALTFARGVAPKPPKPLSGARLGRRK